MALLNCPKIQVDRAYSRPINFPPFLKKLMNITGMSEQWVAARINLYGLIIFPKALGHIDEAVSDLFDQLDKGTTPIPKVEKVSYRVFSKDYSPLRELVATSRRDDISEEKWIIILQNLRAEDVEWRAPWLIPDAILYRCGDFDWVPLAGI
ncbi:hypothetical protein CXB51_009514 [Gossypium anomalum]|uniref:Uncharacterized protein n=1 Tax=Gossypium anomalum TaxID=47600 RepID=A0A8J5ZHV9_9ROSI|nr:hypothetical protein CXB51_009514 [Gossypium anomalum]